MSRPLPARPVLDWYKKAAKKRLPELQAVDRAARLADAQLAIAREHGFGSWRALKARIDDLALHLPPLFEAVRGDDRPRISQLLAERAHLARAADGEGRTALHVGAESNNPDAVDLLLSARADPGAYFGQSAHTALSWALTTEAFEAAEALVRGGVEPDLFCAAGLGHPERVRAFFDGSGRLRPGASRTGSSRFAPDGTRLPYPTAPREVVSDALVFACRLGRTDAVRELRAHDPDLSFRGYLGATALHWAYFGGQRAIIDLLLAGGADPTLRDHEYRCTPRAFGLCVAASWGFPGVFVRALKNEPAAIHLLDGRGTPLHEAARAGHEAIARALLMAGADPTIRDPDGQTPLDLAQAAGHPRVVELLSAPGHPAPPSGG